VLNHPLFDQLDSSLADLVPKEAVEFRGEWSRPSRRTYESQAQAGTGSGPFVDVVDLTWRGTLTSASAISGLVFLHAAHDLYWVKTADASLTLPVDVSLHAYAGHDRATFTASVGGATLPGIPVPTSANLEESCALGPSVLTTGRAASLARAGTAAVVVLVIQRRLLQVGRNHLWRVRDEIASSLPPTIRDLLTRRRTGVIRGAAA
jgi:hypothetical protein